MHAYYRHTGKQPMSLVENVRKRMSIERRELKFPRISFRVEIALHSIGLQWFDLTCPMQMAPDLQWVDLTCPTIG